MTKRERALAAIKAAGYHGDSKTALNLYLNNRVSFQAYQQAYREGIRAKGAGVRCDCGECKTS